MRVLVAYASRHGGTAGIADTIGAVLRETELDDLHVDVVAAADIEEVAGYDAVVVGSAVYAGHWLESARALVRRHAGGLRRRDVWLFSSGPVGDPAVPAAEAVEAPLLAELVSAMGHRTFAGRLRPADLRLDERAQIRSAHAEEGDFRDWAAIRDWAADIAATLTTEAAEAAAEEAEEAAPELR